MQKNFFLQFLLICLFLLCVADHPIAEGTGAIEEEIVVPWKKLYRPRGPPRFGKRAIVLMDDEAMPLEWRKRLE